MIQKFKLKFFPLDKEVEISTTETVLKVAQENDVHIKSVCKGVPSCAECRVQIKEGEHNVIPPSDKEIELIGSAYFVDRSRLSCQLLCFGDVVVDLTEQIEKAKRNTSSKRPRGSSERVEAEESHAVMGTMLLDEAIPVFEEEEVEEEVVDEGTKQSHRQRRRRRRRRSGRRDNAD